MKKLKRILAWIGIILLLSLYILTFIVSFFDSAVSSGLFTACIYTTVAFPCLLYAFQLVYRVLKNNQTN